MHVMKCFPDATNDDPCLSVTLPAARCTECGGG